MDWDSNNLIEAEDIDWDEPFNELKMRDLTGCNRFCSFHAHAALAI